MRRVIYRTVATGAALLVAAVAVADTWDLPEETVSYSPNGKFATTVIPKVLSSQLDYFSDLVEGKENAGAVEGLRDNFARAVLSKVEPSGILVRLSEFRLLNEVAPVTTLVADSGRWVVTLDNWHSIGFGNSVVAIYRQDGTVVQSFALEDLLTEADLARLPRSVSSRYWLDDAVIDESAAELVLSVTRCRPHRDCHDPPVPLRVDLVTGAPKQPVRPIFSQLVPRVTVSSLDPTSLESTVEIQHECRADVNREAVELLEIAPASLLEVVALEAPNYTDIGRKALIRGRVILELLVNRSGTVDCVGILKGLPMGLAEAAQAAAFEWRFVPQPVAARAIFEVQFSLVEEAPPS